MFRQELKQYFQIQYYKLENYSIKQDLVAQYEEIFLEIIQTLIFNRDFDVIKACFDFLKSINVNSQN